jgi:hypothetical protein
MGKLLRMMTLTIDFKIIDIDKRYPFVNNYHNI